MCGGGIEIELPEMQHDRGAKAFTITVAAGARSMRPLTFSAIALPRPSTIALMTPQRYSLVVLAALTIAASMLVLSNPIQTCQSFSAYVRMI
jgi:hypothetical protein